MPTPRAPPPHHACNRIRDAANPRQSPVIPQHRACNACPDIHNTTDARPVRPQPHDIIPVADPPTYTTRQMRRPTNPTTRHHPHHACPDIHNATDPQQYHRNHITPHTPCICRHTLLIRWVSIELRHDHITLATHLRHSLFEIGRQWHLIGIQREPSDGTAVYHVSDTAICVICSTCRRLSRVFAFADVRYPR